MEIIMPQMGETVAEGTISAWHKQEGDAVKADDPLFDVETDKAATEVPAQVDGVLQKIVVPVGETVTVGTIVAVIDTGGEATEQVASTVQEQESEEKKPMQFSATLRPAEANTKLSPVVRRLLAEHNVSEDEVTGTGPGGRIRRDDVLKFVEQRDGKI